MGGKSSWNLLNSAEALILNVGLNLVLIPRFGMEASARLGGVDHRRQPDGPHRGLDLPRDAAVRPGVSAGGVGGSRLFRAGRACRPRDLGTTDVAFVVFTVIAIPAYAAVLSRFDAPASRRSGARIRRRTTGPARPRRGMGHLVDAGPTRVPSLVARRIARAWCMATAQLRRPPDIIVLGRSAGVDVARGLSVAHPQVLPPVPARLAPKGVRAFDEHPDRGRWWYRSDFATVFARGSAKRRRRFAAESTANYLFHREEAARAALLGSGGARRRVASRSGRARGDPLARATRRGLETLPFEDALAAEDEPVRTLPAAARAIVA